LRLPAAPGGTPAWLYKLAIHPKALSDRAPGGRETRNGEAPSPLARSGGCPTRT
jgi:hypothetical protein